MARKRNGMIAFPAKPLREIPEAKKALSGFRTTLLNEQAITLDPLKGYRMLSDLQK
jgi:hypothetical protein